jgi:hypothetical protein
VTGDEGTMPGIEQSSGSMDLWDWRLSYSKFMCYGRGDGGVWFFGSSIQDRRK